MLLLTLASAAIIAAAPTVPVCNANDAVTTAHIRTAKAAMISGDVNTARQQFRIAEVIGRDSGCLPIDAAQGLAQLFFAQQQALEAAEVLQNLATDAAEAGDFDLEARTLVNVAWLQVQAGDRNMAKVSVRRLHELSRDTRLTLDTRSYLKKALR